MFICPTDLVLVNGAPGPALPACALLQGEGQAPPTGDQGDEWYAIRSRRRRGARLSRLLTVRADGGAARRARLHSSGKQFSTRPRMCGKRCIRSYRCRHGRRRATESCIARNGGASPAWGSLWSRSVAKLTVLRAPGRVYTQARPMVSGGASYELRRDREMCPPTTGDAKIVPNFSVPEYEYILTAVRHDIAGFR